MTSFKYPYSKNNWSYQNTPNLFVKNKAVDTWYVGRLNSVDIFDTSTEILNLPITCFLGVSNGWHQKGLPVDGPQGLKGLRNPVINDDNRVAAIFGVDNLENISYDLSAADSFVFVLQTKFSSLPPHHTSGNIIDFGTKGLTSAGIYFFYANFSFFIIIYDDLGNLHTTQFIYPKGFTPYADNIFYTWVWKFNKNNTKGSLFLKAENEEIVDYSVSCVKYNGLDFSALDAITFSGKNAPLILSGYYAAAPASLPINFYQIAFSKDLTYDPGILP